MAVFKGSEGRVKIGANTTAEVKSFNVSSSQELIPDTAMGDSWETHLTGRKKWSGRLDCYWDDTDTNGQETMTLGASVVLLLYPEYQDGASGEAELTGTATITEIEVTVSAENALVERSISFEGNGTLTVGTI